MTKQLIEVHVEGYKPHLCSTEQQVEAVIRDIKTRKPTVECTTKVWEQPFLCYDDARPLAQEEDFTIVDAGDVQLKFCVADFMSLMWNLRHGIEYAEEDLVFLPSGLYCAVLSVSQAKALQEYVSANYNSLKLQEDEYFSKYEKELKQVDSVFSTIAGNKNKKSVIH